jgi:hypothetical protein
MLAVLALFCVCRHIVVPLKLLAHNGKYGFSFNVNILRFVHFTHLPLHHFIRLLILSLHHFAVLSLCFLGSSTEAVQSVDELVLFQLRTQTENGFQS